MLETEAMLKRWGSSVGLILPKGSLKKEDLKVGQRVIVRVMKKISPLRQTFGTLKFRKSTEELLRESDQEMWHD